MQNKTVLVRFLAVLVVCGLSFGCSPAKQEDAQAFHAINTWKGQNIQFAIDRLGQPDKVTTGKKGHFYFWYNSREINTALTANTLPVKGGQRITYDPNSPGFNKEVHCRIRLFTDFDNTILHYRFGGNTLACQKLAEQVNDADEKSGKDENTSGNDKTNPAPGWE
jgi:hypothetical protein